MVPGPQCQHGKVYTTHIYRERQTEINADTWAHRQSQIPAGLVLRHIMDVAAASGNASIPSSVLPSTVLYAVNNGSPLYAPQIHTLINTPCPWQSKPNVFFSRYNSKNDIAPVVTTTSVIFSSDKVESGDILVPAYSSYPGKWPVNECHCLSRHNIKSPSLFHFNGHFPGEPGLPGFIAAKDDRSDGDNWSYRTCKALVKSSPPTNQQLPFYRPDGGCPYCRPTNSVRALKGKMYHIPQTCSPQAHLWVF